MKNNKFLIILQFSVILVFLLILARIGSAIDTHVNLFDAYPTESTFGSQTYIQQLVWLGTSPTSSALPADGGGPDDGIIFDTLTAGSTSSLDYEINVGSLYLDSAVNLYLWADWDLSQSWEDTELFIDEDITVSGAGSYTGTLDFSIPVTASGDIWFNVVATGNNPLSDNIPPEPTGAYNIGEQEAFLLNVFSVPEPATFLLVIGLLLGLGIVPKQKRDM